MPASRPILVTGARGFLGKSLRAVLAEELPDVPVVGADLEEDATGDVRAVDLEDAEAARALLADLSPEWVFHLAGVWGSDWDRLYEGYVRVTANVLDASLACGAPVRVVLPGSAAEYGDVPAEEMPLTEDRATRPVSAYGVAKAWQTTVALMYGARGADVVVGRIFNVVGRRLPEAFAAAAVSARIWAIADGGAPPTIPVGNTETVRDFLDVSDACRALVSLAEKGRSGLVYNVCSGTGVAMRDVFDTLVELSGVEAELRVDESLVREGDIASSIGSARRIADDTGWAPRVRLRDSLSETLADARERVAG